MEKNMNNPSMYSDEALCEFNKRRSELSEKPKGLSSFPKWYDFKNLPKDWQWTALKKFFPMNECGILFEQGLGKTFTAINLSTAWRATDQIDSVVVICPSSVKLVWEEELEKHCPMPIDTHVLRAGKYRKADEFIQNKTEFQWLVVSVESLSQGKASDFVERFMIGRKCGIIVDESSRIKTPNKIRTDKCINMAKKYSYKRMILSGTSLTQGIEDWYTQFKFLNEDILGFDSFYTFRARFCVTTNIMVTETRSIIKIVGYKNEDELIKLVAPYVLRVEKKDVLDLPSKEFSNRIVTMNPVQKKMYQEMKHEMYLSAKGEQDYEVTTVLEQMMRLQQITGGFYPHDDGDKIVPRPIKGKNPKVEELIPMLDGSSEKVIIWCQFRPEIGLISERLTKKGIGFVEFHGGKNDDEKKFAVDQIRNNPDCKVFLATRAAAYGLTMTEVTLGIYYSQGHSLDQYSQSQDRNHRMGQNEKCTYVHLVCENTVDLKIIKSLEAKQSLADMVYSMLKDEG